MSSSPPIDSGESNWVAIAIVGKTRGNRGEVTAVTLSSKLERFEDLHEVYRRAAVYVQASRHEGFGLAVAEAMLAGCVPVVMNVTAMPEVVGDAGVLIESQEPDEVAEAVRRALGLGPEAARRARERILTAFPMQRRREGILRVVEDALHG